MSERVDRLTAGLHRVGAPVRGFERPLSRLRVPVSPRSSAMSWITGSIRPVTPSTGVLLACTRHVTALIRCMHRGHAFDDVATRPHDGSRAFVDHAERLPEKAHVTKDEAQVTE